MKKNILVTGALILAAVIFVTSGICVFAAEKNSFPPAGVYFARHEHYTAWTDSAYNPYFTLQVYEVKGGERFLEYEDILLRDENGKDYSLKDASIQVIFSDVYFTSYRLVCVLDRNNLPKDETVFTYAVMRGTEKNNIFPIGRVTVSIGDCNSALTFAGLPVRKTTSGLNSLNGIDRKASFPSNVQCKITESPLASRTPSPIWK